MNENINALGELIDLVRLKLFANQSIVPIVGTVGQLAQAIGALQGKVEDLEKATPMNYSYDSQTRGIIISYGGSDNGGGE